jgi:hypothetical protein
MEAGQRLTARAVARVLQGRDSPAFPRNIWSKCPGWSRAVHVDFETLRRLAQDALLSSGQGARQGALPPACISN